MYEPVVATKDGDLGARALVGSHSIMLSWDHDGPAADRADLLGFAIHRTNLTTGRDTWLQGQRRFAADAAAGINIESRRAPFQRFRWGDYGAYPGHRYRYEIHPVRRTDAHLDPPLVLEVTASKPVEDGIGLYSNRGVTASLAYRTKFGEPPQDLAGRKQRDAYAWLTRDIRPALFAFIDRAKAGDELRVAAYEFEDEAIIDRLNRALGRGVAVRLVVHARPGDSQTEDNQPGLALLAQGAEVHARTNVPNISHNKFIVHLSPDAGGALVPVRVWTGSANFTRAALYLQTNLALEAENPALAAGFASYWELLRGNPVAKDARKAINGLVTAVRATMPGGPQLHLSPVSGAELLDVAVDLVRNASSLVLISSPFGLDGRIIEAINTNAQSIVEYGLVNTTSGRMLDLLPFASSRFSWFTTPSWLPELDGQPWDAKPVGQHKIHAKLIVADPYGPVPRVLVGSANFSDESVNRNDENALLFEGNGRVAAIAATEFLRMFDHYKTRAFIAGLEQNPEDVLLAETGDWSRRYYTPCNLKCMERKVFAHS